MQATLIYPHQLFDAHPGIAAGRGVWLVEEPLLFTQFKFHKQKLVLHRASMRAYAGRLLKAGHRVHYVECLNGGRQTRGKGLAESAEVFERLARARITEVHVADVVDDWLGRRLRAGCARHGIRLVVHETPMFVTTPDVLERWFGPRESYFMADFYRFQRLRLGILVDPKTKSPAGGKWSFDAENRRKLPKNISLPDVPRPAPNEFVREAVQHVGAFYADHNGQLEPFGWPVTHEQAAAWLARFIEERLPLFGDYEDAIAEHEQILFHGALTPMLNIGLLTPGQVLEAVLAPDVVRAVPLNALEGFVRQVIGWREFIRGVYVHAGGRQRTRNFWGHTRSLPESFWTGTTGLAPADAVIGRVLGNGYAHHIERLMVLGSLMLMLEVDPDHVYRWFMELFIDAYDWVMVPNVYGMSQFADGGLMATKPYISGSNYLKKMSDFRDGRWVPAWDGLYWRFIARHREFFEQNPRLGMMVRLLDKMPPEKRSEHLKGAEQVLR